MYMNCFIILLLLSCCGGSNGGRSNGTCGFGKNSVNKADNRCERCDDNDKKEEKCPEYRYNQESCDCNQNQRTAPWQSFPDYN